MSQNHNNLKTINPAFKRPKKVVGKSVVLRDARPEDAAFILSLRTDPKKSTFLSPTSTAVFDQEQWLIHYANDSEQIYFVIEDLSGNPLGTVRLYDRKQKSFCWGSWILHDSSPRFFAIESALMVYCLGLELGFSSAHFDVKQGNQSVCNFHERFGAIRTATTTDSYEYSISEEAIKKSLTKYIRFLPNGIQTKY